MYSTALADWTMSFRVIPRTIVEGSILPLSRLPSRFGLLNTPTEFLQGGKNPLPNECLGYDIKQSDGEVPMIRELLGMQNTPSLSSLPFTLWPEMVSPDRALSLSQKELNCVLMLN